MDFESKQATDDFVVVFITVPNQDIATSMARTLVEEKLVACVNIVPGIRSIYAWQGKICDDAELLCILKTRRGLFPELRARVVALHPYDVPEVIAVPIAAGHEPYLAWLRGETRAPSVTKAD